MLVRKARDAEAGFSLIELMVGMVLGLMLIAGAVSIYLASKRSYIEVEQVAALTENARFAEQVLGDSLRHIGFLGEVTANRVEVDPGLPALASGNDCDSPAEAGAYDLNRLGYAVTADASGNALGCITDARPGTDVLVIKRALTQPYTDGPRVGGDPNDPTLGDGTIDTPGPLDNGKTYIMTNNVSGLLFEGSSPPTITVGGEVPGGAAWEYLYEVFYIRDGDVPQLSRKYLDWNGAAMQLRSEDLTEGVENLRVLFGYDSDGNGEVDTYASAAAIGTGGHWENVESVEVYMLVRSATGDVQYKDEKTYRLGDLSVGPYNDQFRRLISHTSVSLRNLKLLIRGGA